MSAKIELSLAPAKAKGLSEDERLDLGRLLLKAGYRVDIVRRRPNTNPGTNYDYFMRNFLSTESWMSACESALIWSS